MEPEFLSLEAVIRIHGQVIAETPEEPSGIHSRPALESAVMSPMHHYFQGGVDDLCTLAAHYLFHITMNHGFLAGNKRTAVAACVTFLHLNGLECAINVDSFEALVLQMIGRAVEIDDIAEYLRQCTDPLSPSM